MRLPLCTLVVLVLVGQGCSMAARGPVGPGAHVAPAADRDYDLFVPQRDSDAARPLVVAFHGAFSSTDEMAEESRLNELAEREGFVVAYPRGSGFLGLLRHWNSGHCCGPASEADTDDVGYTQQVIRSVRERVSIDSARIYLVGMSNGAMMAHRVAAELSDQIAATATVSGTIGGRPSAGEDVWRIPRPKRPVPMLVIHGDADDIVPYDGGDDPYSLSGRTWLPVDDTISFWRASNRATEERRRDDLASGQVTRTEWRGESPREHVVHYRIAGWGHAWPGRAYTRELPEDAPLTSFEAAEPIWAFLQQHRLGASAGTAS